MHIFPRLAFSIFHFSVVSIFTSPAPTISIPETSKSKTQPAHTRERRRKNTKKWSHWRRVASWIYLTRSSPDRMIHSHNLFVFFSWHRFLFRLILSLWSCRWVLIFLAISRRFFAYLFIFVVVVVVFCCLLLIRIKHKKNECCLCAQPNTPFSGFLRRFASHSSKNLDHYGYMQYKWKRIEAADKQYE